MYDQNTENSRSKRGYRTDRGEALATAAMIFGIASIPCVIYVFPSVFFASLALTLAILSKGRDSRLGHRAKIGAITGTVSFSLLALIAVIVTVFFVSNPDMWNDFKSLYQEQYNRILEEFEDMSEEDYQQKGKQLW